MHCSFFPLKSALAIWSLLNFYRNNNMQFSTSVKNVIRNLKIASDLSNLWMVFSNMTIFILFILVFHEYGRSFYLLVSSWVSLFSFAAVVSLLICFAVLVIGRHFTTWATVPILFCFGYFGHRVSLYILEAYTTTLLCASHITRMTGTYHCTHPLVGMESCELLPCLALNYRQSSQSPPPK
jgi:hypothetical protein